MIIVLKGSYKSHIIRHKKTSKSEKTKKVKQVRNVRKDKGVPKKPIATILTGHIVSSEGHFEAVRNVDWYVHLQKVNKPKKKKVLILYIFI
jgi:hypothetical protein